MAHGGGGGGEWQVHIICSLPSLSVALPSTASTPWSVVVGVRSVAWASFGAAFAHAALPPFPSPLVKPPLVAVDDSPRWEASFVLTQAVVLVCFAADTWGLLCLFCCWFCWWLACTLRLAGALGGTRRSARLAIAAAASSNRVRWPRLLLGRAGIHRDNFFIRWRRGLASSGGASRLARR